MSQTGRSSSLPWSSLQITHNQTKNEQPQLDTRHVVWQAWDGSHWQIESEDLSTGAITQLTTDQLDKTGPRLTSDRAVWTTHLLMAKADVPDSYVAPIPTPVLTVYDYRDGKTTTIPGSVGARGVQVSGDLVAWVAGDGDRAAVYVYDFAAPRTRDLSNSQVPQSQLATDGRWVVYVTRTAGHDEVWANDVRSGERRQVSESGATGTVTDLALNAGRVVWVEHGAEYRLEFVDLATNQRRELAREAGKQSGGSVGGASGLATGQGEPPLLMSPVTGGTRLAYTRFTNPGRPVMPHESPWSVVLLDLTTQKQTVIEGANGALWMQANGALLAYSVFESGQGEVLHLYDTGTDVDSTPSLDPERRTSGGSTGSGRALFLPTSGGGLIGPSLAEGRVAFAVYQSVNTQSDETDVILAYRGTAPPLPHEKAW